MKKYMVVLALLCLTVNLNAGSKEKKENSLQNFSNQIFDNQRSTVSNVDFYNTNYGVFGQNRTEGETWPTQSSGTFWPRGTNNSYTFAAGIWFGAMKTSPVSQELDKYCLISYGPNNGISCLIPGITEDCDSASFNLSSKNRLYVSSKYNSDGTSIEENTPNWPLWINDNTQSLQYGTYGHTFVNDINERNSTQYPMGPLFVSDEDMFSSFKDTDLNYYLGDKAYYEEKGYPLRLQFKQRVYSWASEELQDVVVIYYTIENNSTDTLYNCWIAPVIDTDIIGNYSDSVNKDRVTNDRARYFSEREDLNLVVAWSEATFGDEGNNLGYLGISLLETPAVDINRNIRHDKAVYLPSEQIGATSYRHWDISEDIVRDTQCYNFLSNQIIDVDNGASDKRCLISSGPFHLAPGDTARMAVLLSFAMPAKGGEADGTYEDITGIFSSGKYAELNANKKPLLDKVNDIKSYYYQAVKLNVEDATISSIDFDRIYPNPTNNAISLSYSLGSSGNVTISLYNCLGEKVKDLYSGWQNSGNLSQQFELNSDNITSGLYYIRIASANEIKTKAINIIK